MHAGNAVYHPWAHRLAVATLCAVFPLIFVGAGVTSKDAGMAYPDGFYSNGHLWNPPGWTASEATLWEHGHRLIGRVVGLLAIALVVVSWNAGRSLRTMSLVTLSAIVVQGVLGWQRVDLISTGLAMVHGVGAQICFCIVAATVLMSSRFWLAHPVVTPVRAGGFLTRLCLVVAIVVFVQMVTGAATRHFPSQVTIGLHVFLAIVVTFLVGWVGMWVTGSFPAVHPVGLFGRIVGAAMVAQLFLGGASFLVITLNASTNPLIQWLVPTLHTVTGACLLAGCVLMYLSCQRMVSNAADTRSFETVVAVT